MRQAVSPHLSSNEKFSIGHDSAVYGKIAARGCCDISCGRTIFSAAGKVGEEIDIKSSLEFSKAKAQARLRAAEQGVLSPDTTKPLFEPG